MKSFLLTFTCLFIFYHSQWAQDIVSSKRALDQKVQVLLVGSSHWNYYEGGGSDVAQTGEPDILADQYQRELEGITAAIAQFNPKKVFVEVPIDRQHRLDSIYQEYVKDEEWLGNKRNEIFQLAFRVAKKLKHKSVWGIDYRKTSFNYNQLMAAYEEAGQKDLIKLSEKDINYFEDAYNSLVNRKASLKEMYQFLNSDEMRKQDLDWYLNYANQGGKLDNDAGSFLASEWIKRNIYSYGLILKLLERADDKVMILMGSSHTAAFSMLMQTNPNIEIVEIVDLLE